MLRGPMMASGDENFLKMNHNEECIAADKMPVVGRSRAAAWRFDLSCLLVLT